MNTISLYLDTLLDGNNVNLLVALLAGVVTFFASCLLPLVPTYLAYLSGVSLSDDQATTQRWRIFKTALAFVTGFVTTFVMLGLLVAQFAPLVAAYRDTLTRISGVLFIVLGLSMLGVFKSGWWQSEFKLQVSDSFKKFQLLYAFLVGVAFGLGWTPCIGPVLAVILFWSTRQETQWQGVMLLVSYGVGLGLPFLAVAALFEKLVPWLKQHARLSEYAVKFSGAVVVLAGVLFLLGQFQVLSLALLELLQLRKLAF